MPGPGCRLGGPGRCGRGGHSRAAQVGTRGRRLAGAACSPSGGLELRARGQVGGRSARSARGLRSGRAGSVVAAVRRDRRDGCGSSLGRRTDSAGRLVLTGRAGRRAAGWARPAVIHGSRSARPAGSDSASTSTAHADRVTSSGTIRRPTGRLGPAPNRPAPQRPGVPVPDGRSEPSGRLGRRTAPARPDQVGQPGPAGGAEHRRAARRTPTCWAAATRTGTASRGSRPSAATSAAPGLVRRVRIGRTSAARPAARPRPGSGPRRPARRPDRAAAGSGCGSAARCCRRAPGRGWRRRSAPPSGPRPSRRARPPARSSSQVEPPDAPLTGQRAVGGVTLLQRSVGDQPEQPVHPGRAGLLDVGRHLRAQTGGWSGWSSDSHPPDAVLAHACAADRPAQHAVGAQPRPPRPPAVASRPPGRRTRSGRPGAAHPPASRRPARRARSPRGRAGGPRAVRARRPAARRSADRAPARCSGARTRDRSRSRAAGRPG